MAEKKSTAARRLSEQEEAFARAYALDLGGNAAAAARAAGYAEASCRVAGNRLLKREHVRARIAELRDVPIDRLNEAGKASKAAKAKQNRQADNAQPANIAPANAAAPPDNKTPQAVISDAPLPAPLPNDLVLSLDAVIREVALIGFANIADFITVDSYGGAVVDLSRATRDQLAAVKEIKVEEFAVGRGDDARTAIRTTLKLSDKLPALIALGKHLGGFREKVDVDVPTDGPFAELIGMLRGIKRSALPVAPADWTEAEVVR